MKIIYADPPYIGQAQRHYSDDPQCAEVDHNELLAQLVKADGWALSASSTSLKRILSMPNCPDEVRIGAWVKPFASFKPNVKTAYAWEPVLFMPARNRGKEFFTVRDFVSANITMRRGVHGAKPDAFCYWLFEILGMDKDDEFIDMFTGSGAVKRAHTAWVNQPAFRLSKSIESQMVME